MINNEWSKFRLHISSARSCHFRHEEDIDLEDYGFTKDVWFGFTEEGREVRLDMIAQEIMFDSYVEYSVEEINYDS